MLFWILLIAFGAFVLYALFTQFTKTNADESIPKRMMTALVSAAMALGALIMSYFQSGTPTP